MNPQTAAHRDARTDLHSEQGAVRGEHPGRARNPVIKVDDIAWLEFEKPDLTRAETFAHAFGFPAVMHTVDELQLRGTDPAAPCLFVRRGARSRFVGVAFTHDLPARPAQASHVFNFDHDLRRINATQRSPREPARAAAGSRGAAVDEIQGGAGLVSRAPRDDRQRLPLLPGPTRAGRP